MNEKRKEELLTRWMDEELSDEELRELEPVLAEHPEIREERAEFRQMREELQAAIPAQVEPPYPDFFNSHLERLVQGAVRSDEIAGAKRAGLGRLWRWWLAPAAAAAIVAAFIAGMNTAPEPSPAIASPGASEVYSPLSTVSTEVINHDEALGATLIVVEGLEELGDQDLVVGDGSIEGEHGFFVGADFGPRTVPAGEIY